MTGIHLSPAASVAIGIIVGLVSTSIQSIGLTLQRKSHLLEDEKEDELIRRPAHRRRRWQLGMGMFVLANLVGSSIQITTLPLPVLSTLQASGLVFNTLCAALILKEPFTRWSLLGTVLIAGGAVLIALYGSVPEPAHSLQDLLLLLRRQQFLLWMMGTALIILASLVAAWVIYRLRARYTHRMRVIRGMIYGAISAILSAHSLLVAKSAVELIVRTIIDRVNQFGRWQSWVILIVLLALALLQLFFLHRGLKLVSTSLLYPFVFCIYNIIAILDGLIYFNQIEVVSVLDGCLIALGTLILLAGVFALSWRLGDPTPPPDAHSFFTPGMGIVEDTTTEDEAETASPFDSDDEQALNASERTPLLRNGRDMTPTTKDNAILNLTKKRRQRFSNIGADDIWDEIQDVEASRTLPSPLSPKSRRRASTLNHVTATLRAGDESEAESPGIRSSRISRAQTTAPGRERTWRERDRERRRRRGWSRSYRAVSTPVSAPALKLPKPRNAAQANEEGPGETPVRSRRTSWAGWLFGRRRQSREHEGEDGDANGRHEGEGDEENGRGNSAG